ncbi:hypothetical protein CERSUDRAFT_76223 [Gelatoporia subvermispora B]|uniref:Uncharacterized protein n=1 Tax=Ceriporiopsis subvermispora (strain B) TaxID=914234 RepID=M2R5A9_CERS8|nr:hypothetical protein CERSUDRAFT_76223 [Gelatoporia subvermispora B]
MSSAPAFLSLRLSDAQNSYYNVDDDPGLWKRSSAREQRVRVRGYNEEAAAAIRACANSGEDFIDIPWGSVDLVACIMRRLEERLKIPNIYWVGRCQFAVLQATPENAWGTSGWPVTEKFSALKYSRASIYCSEAGTSWVGILWESYLVSRELTRFPELDLVPGNAIEGYRKGDDETDL